MSRVIRKPALVSRCNTKQAVQAQKMVRGFKFLIKEVEGLHYLFSENKSADQLYDHCAADLHLCFCTCKKQVFS